MRTFTTIFIFVALLFSQIVLPQQTDNFHLNPLSGRFSLNREGGGTYARTDFSNDQISYIGQLSLDYYFQSHSIGVFGLRGFGYYG